VVRGEAVEELEPPALPAVDLDPSGVAAQGMQWFFEELKLSV
jgi:hypothetical protein